MDSQIIYIIDDDQQSVDLLVEFVKLMGCEGRAYTDASLFFDDIDSIKEGSIMILDLKMPGMDGIEVMRQMVKIETVLPLVLISGYDAGVLHSAEQLAKAYSFDIIASITKPFQFDDLKEILGKYKKIEIQHTARKKLFISVFELEKAMLNNELILHYQPKIDIKSGSFVGVEALVRWQHPKHGLIYPDAFISIAENNGLINDLTTQVFGQAMSQIVKWDHQGLVLQISVNLSADNISSLTLPEQISGTLESHQIDPARLTLEITESMLMQELTTALNVLTRLRIKGINLSIDDFGTGYSSLSQLYRMPFTELKVDKSFVMSMATDDEARGIVKTCIILGHELNMKIVAEGVEDKETLECLSEMGCDIVQGFYMARPMPAENIIDWDNNRK